MRMVVYLIYPKRKKNTGIFIFDIDEEYVKQVFMLCCNSTCKKNLFCFNDNVNDARAQVNGRVSNLQTDCESQD